MAVGIHAKNGAIALNEFCFLFACLEVYLMTQSIQPSRYLNSRSVSGWNFNGNFSSQHSCMEEVLGSVCWPCSSIPRFDFSDDLEGPWKSQKIEIAITRDDRSDFMNFCFVYWSRFDDWELMWKNMDSTFKVIEGQIQRPSDFKYGEVCYASINTGISCFILQ